MRSQCSAPLLPSTHTRMNNAIASLDAFLQIHEVPLLTRLDLGEKHDNSKRLPKCGIALNGQGVLPIPVQVSSHLLELTTAPSNWDSDLPQVAEQLRKLALTTYCQCSATQIALLTKFASLRKLRIMCYNVEYSNRNNILAPFSALTRYAMSTTDLFP